MDIKDLPVPPPQTQRLGRMRSIARTGGSESPIAALVNSLLHPLLATATLIGCVHAFGETFSGHYLLLTVLTFFICSQVFDEINILVPWSSFHLTRLIRGVVVGWAVVAAILLFLGYATQLTENFDQSVILTWFGVTPFVLLAGTKLARSIVRRAVVTGVVARSAVVVGANELGRELAARLGRDLYTGINIRGYFDDRGGRVFSDTKWVLLKWMNCSIVTAAMPIFRSSDDEAFTQEPFPEVQGAHCTGSA